MSRAKNYRKKNEEALALALACGASVEAAALQCQVSERTVYRRLDDPAFRARVQEAQGEMVKRSAGMLTAAAGESVQTLLSLQKDSMPPAVRLAAARAILAIGIQVREMVDLETQIAALEAQRGRVPSEADRSPHCDGGQTLGIRRVVVGTREDVEREERANESPGAP